MTTHLDISIGPVQGFVSQSRRTRDLWGSSYLLAFLSAHAMWGAHKAGGKIIQPLVDDDPLFKWVCGQRTGDPPRIGTLPNHFGVETDDDPKTAAAAARRSFDDAWKRVCDAVWDRYVGHAVVNGNRTESIWKRQVGTFWEFTWTAGPPDDGVLLARRKHWRSHRPPDEPGDKCTVMHDLQELSGFVRALDSEKQDGFWNRIRSRAGDLNLRDKERLCAVALVKRLFPGVAEEALGWEADAWHWPSTVYVGAIPWIRRVVNAAPKEAREYANAVRQSAAEGVFPMKSPPFDGLRVPEAGDFPKLDANYVHREFVLDGERCPMKEGADRQGLAEMLEAIYGGEGEYGCLGAPPTFYALLLADGDRLGKLVGEVKGDVVSKVLASFTSEVPKIARKHDGVTVYAGGDDVMAMLPVDRALECADAISTSYRAAFANTKAGDKATLSAAVVFAHVRLPLSSVLREARYLLDNVAKDGNGRNSLAAAVLKPSGRYCQWVRAWTRPAAEGEVRAVDLIGQLRSDLGDGAAEPGLSSSLLYRIRDTLSMLCGWGRWEPGSWGNIPDRLELEPFLRAEILRSLAVRMDDGARERAEALAGSVVSLLPPVRNPQPGEDDDSATAKAGVDALLLARFLADPDDRGPDR